MDENTKQYTEKAKGWAGKAKRMSDDAVKKYGEKLPDSVSKYYDKASATAGKYLPDDAEAADGTPADESTEDA
jgi:ferritin-like protein